MCAIFGVLGSCDPEAAREAFDTLRHRGPDDSRFVREAEGCFGVHRLAIESAGEPPIQPFESQGWRLLFNGEIYNYRQLGRELGLEELDEVRVLLAAFRRWGRGFVERLRGMYALAIHAPGGDLWLFRDPAGKKPLFYLERPDFFAYASEAKALYRLKPFFFERRHLPAYLTFQSTVAPRTLDREVRKLPPGGWLHLHEGRIEQSSYDPWLEGDILHRQEESAARAVGQALEEAVELRIPAGRNWGVLLSGGLDSSLVAALAAERSGEPIRTFSIGYDGYPNYDERPYAETVARHLGSEHRSYRFGREQFFETLERWLGLLDEPLGDPAAVPLLYLMERARHDGIRVLLGGEGSDELFLGYGLYREYYGVEEARTLPYRGWLANYFRSHYSPNKEWEWFKRAWEGEPIFRSTAELYTDLQLARLLRQNVRDGESLDAIEPYLEGFRASRRSHPADWYSYLDLKIMLAEVYLVKQDRVSMAAGIEARSPFLDSEVIRSAFCIDPALRMDTAPKGVLRRYAASRLPEAIVTRRKKGLNYPFIEWIIEDGGLESIDRIQRRLGLFRSEQLEFLSARVERGRFRQHLFPLYLLARWLEAKGF